jgi:hypothetical protein
MKAKRGVGARLRARVFFAPVLAIVDALSRQGPPYFFGQVIPGEGLVHEFD